MVGRLIYPNGLQLPTLEPPELLVSTVRHFVGVVSPLLAPHEGFPKLELHGHALFRVLIRGLVPVLQTRDEHETSL